MTLNSELLAILACPKCKEAVTYHENSAEIVCLACRLSYPVRDEIPVMLIDEATSLADES